MFIDVKSHIMYGTEPLCMCADDEEMALVMAYNAHQQGCRFILATPPHSAFLTAGLYDHVRFTRLADKIHHYMPDMKLGLGCQLECTEENIGQLIKYLEEGRLPTLNDSRYVLVSFPADVSRDNLWHCLDQLSRAGYQPTLNDSRYVLVSFQEDVSREDLWYCLDQLSRAGYQPILSHAETIQCLDINEILCLKGEGPRDNSKYHFQCKIQLDTYALHPHDPRREKAQELIRSRVVDLLGTDARNTSSFPAYIQGAVESMKDLCSQDDPDTVVESKKHLSLQDYLEAICWKNAAELLGISLPVSR